MKKCNKKLACKTCKYCNVKFPKNNTKNNIIVFCLECDKYGFLGDNFEDLRQNVLDDLSE